jgi:hypothetical protein
MKIGYNDQGIVKRRKGIVKFIVPKNRVKHDILGFNGHG